MNHKTDTENPEKHNSELPPVSFLENGLVLIPVFLNKELFLKLFKLSLIVDSESHPPNVVLSEMINHYLPECFDVEIAQHKLTSESNVVSFTLRH